MFGLFHDEQVVNTVSMCSSFCYNKVVIDLDLIFDDLEFHLHLEIDFDFECYPELPIL